MLTTAFLDRDLLGREALGRAPPARRESGPQKRGADARLCELRAILKKARGQAIRPRGAYSKRSA